MTFAAQEIPAFCGNGDDPNFHVRWFYTRRLDGEPFGDDPTATVEVVALRGRPGGFHPVVQNIANGHSYVFKIRLTCGHRISP